MRRRTRLSDGIYFRARNEMPPSRNEFQRQLPALSRIQPDLAKPLPDRPAQRIG